MHALEHPRRCRRDAPMFGAAEELEPKGHTREDAARVVTSDDRFSIRQRARRARDGGRTRADPMSCQDRRWFFCGWTPSCCGRRGGLGVQSAPTMVRRTCCRVRRARGGVGSGCPTASNRRWGGVGNQSSAQYPVMRWPPRGCSMCQGRCRSFYVPRGLFLTAAPEACCAVDPPMVWAPPLCCLGSRSGVRCGGRRARLGRGRCRCWFRLRGWR
ncbi:MAG: hypothetical protein QOD72_1269 [Acidimicrobiaceae bacterium]|nr:hypothetical protein [Acidimicrobiaceae bacterium]